MGVEEVDQEKPTVYDMGKAREESVRKNIVSVIEYSKVTRQLLIDQGQEILFLRNTVELLQNQMKVMDDQLSAMQVKVYSGPVTTSGD